MSDFEHDVIQKIVVQLSVDLICCFTSDTLTYYCTAYWLSVEFNGKISSTR